MLEVIQLKPAFIMRNVINIAIISLPMFIWARYYVAKQVLNSTKIFKIYIHSGVTYRHVFYRKVEKYIFKLSIHNVFKFVPCYQSKMFSTKKYY